MKYLIGFAVGLFLLSASIAQATIVVDLSAADVGVLINETFHLYNEDPAYAPEAWDNGTYGVVGNTSSGTVVVNDGSFLACNYAYIGNSLGSTGVASVTEFILHENADYGVQSRWDLAHLCVGNAGHGTFNISNGAWAATMDAIVGNNANSVGTINVSGLEYLYRIEEDTVVYEELQRSTWDNNGFPTYIGYEGTGTLSISGGGIVNSINQDPSLFYIGYETGSEGEVNVSGYGEYDDVNDYPDAGMIQEYSELNVDCLYVGYKGTGELNIGSGNTVTAESVWVGTYTETVDYLEVLRFTDNCETNFTGGTLSIGGSLLAGKSQLKGTGSIETRGLIVDKENVTVSAMPTDNSPLQIQYTGTNQAITINLVGDGSSFFGAGHSGSGSVEINNGVNYQSTHGYVGLKNGSDGTVTVTGNNSTWDLNGELHIGYEGTGRLDIENGGQVGQTSNSPNTYIGRFAGSDGQVNVSGTNSELNCSALFIGYQGKGAMTISTGGSVNVPSTHDSYIGYAASSLGEACVYGTGSTWDAGNLYIGFGGTGVYNNQQLATHGGSLTIENSGVVNCNNAYIGHEAGSTGYLEVGESGSTFTSSSALIVGHDGTGKVWICDGGDLSTYGGSIGQNSNGTGTVSVDYWSTWDNNSSELYVGHTGNGTLNIRYGSTVNNSNGYIGNNLGSSGEVTVNNATWANTGRIIVGNYGTGVLSIDNYAHVTSQGDSIVGLEDVTLALGEDLGSVTVSDHATWNNNLGSLTIGYGDRGYMEITGGGKVTSVDGYVARGVTSQGTVEISGSGSEWDIDGDLYIGHTGLGSSGALGTLQVTLGGRIAAEHLYLGEHGSIYASNGGIIDIDWYLSDSGNITIDPGGTWILNSDFGWTTGVTVNDNGSIWVKHGIITPPGNTYLTNGKYLQITGSGSHWNNAGHSIFINNDGRLLIEAGGHATCQNAYVGGSGDSSWAEITGAESEWTVTSELSVSSNGTVYVTDSGHVTANILEVNDGGTVNINTQGTMKTANLQLNTGCTVNINNGGILELANNFNFQGWDNSSTWGTGGGTVNFNNGTIAFTNGSIVAASVDTTLGDGQALTITGSNATNDSTWNSTGYNMTINDGSLRLEAGGDATCLSGYVGYGVGTTGTATVTGAGSTWTTTSHLYTGYNGSGELTISGSGLVDNSGNCFVGYASSSTGVLNVNGATLDNNSGLVVGLHGHGAMHISGGGDVTNTVGYIGSYTYTTGSGEVTVDGAGSTWTNSGNLSVGLRGMDATLTITNGGVVTNNTGVLGFYSDGAGSATVDGNGSTWTNNNNLYVGREGAGTLTITNDGTVSCDYAYVANAVSSTGTVSVIDGGTWIIGDDLYVADSGVGTLFINGEDSRVQVGDATGDTLSIGTAGSIKMCNNGELALFGDADSDNSGTISLTEFEDMILENGDYILFFDTGGYNDWVSLDMAASSDYSISYTAGYSVLTVSAVFDDGEGDSCSVVPEPGTVALMLSALVGLGMLVIRKRK